MIFIVNIEVSDESVPVLLEALHQFNPSRISYHLSYLKGRLSGEGLADPTQISNVVRIRDGLLSGITRAWNNALQSKLIHVSDQEKRDMLRIGEGENKNATV